jgi:two-component system response regulator HupR/HoxA
MQVKLLRVLEDGTFNAVGSDDLVQVKVRVIAATNKNLEEMVRKGTFREDLYYRLKKIEIKIPPLRERKQDILFLAKVFCDEFMPGMKLTKETKDILEKHRWGGNIRELKNTIETACVKAHAVNKSKIEPCHILLTDLGIGEEAPTLPSDLIPKTKDELNAESYQRTLDWVDRYYLKRGLELTDDDNGALMDLINMTKTVYYEKKKKLGLSDKQRGTVA